MEQGIGTVALCVEGDNEPALAMYRRLGFTEHVKDVLYAAYPRKCCWGPNT